MVQQQRRSRVIAMSPAELDAFLGEQRTCRLATTGPGGPHVAPLWFVWDGQALWVSSLTRSQRWANVARDPRVAVVIDDGHHYHELRGVEIEGEAVPVGPVPRPAGGPAFAELAEPEPPGEIIGAVVDQALRIGIMNRVQQQRVHDSEHRGVRSNAESQNDDNGPGHQRRAQQNPDAEAQIL